MATLWHEEQKIITDLGGSLSATLLQVDSTIRLPGGVGNRSSDQVHDNDDGHCTCLVANAKQLGKLIFII